MKRESALWKDAPDRDPGPMRATGALGRRRAMDALARVVVVVGGLTIIASVLAIFFLICGEVVPLFGNPGVERRDPIALGGPPVFIGVEEQQELAFMVRPEGVVRIVDLSTRETKKDVPLKKVPGATLACGVRPLANPVACFGTSDGRMLPVAIRFRADFDEAGRRTIVPSVLERDAIAIDEQKRKISALAFQSVDAGDAAAAITEDGRVFYVATSGDVTEITKLVGERLTCVVLDRYLEHLYVGTHSGCIVHIDVREQPAAVDTLSVGTKPVTALAFLNGDNSLVVGDEAGALSVWFQADGPGGVRRLTRVHEFEPHSAAVTSIVPSERDRCFVTADRSGEVRLHYATTGRTLARMKGAASPVVQVALAPKSNGIYALHGNDSISRWSLANPHPEITGKALFGELWYEGYAKPEAVWQSTGGTDDFEPKFSLLPLIFGTLKGTFYALLLALPISILAALYTAQFVHPSVRGFIKPTIEIMAALPSVVLGFLAGLWLAPVVERSMPALILMAVLLPLSTLAAMGAWRLLPLSWRSGSRGRLEIALLVAAIGLAAWICVRLNGAMERGAFGGDFRQWWFTTTGLAFDQRNALVVGFAMGFAVIPIIFTIAEDALSNVPRHLVSGSLALGATRWQTAVRVVLPTASPGIFSAIMIGFGRAVGETMIVLMATGNTPIMEWNIFNGFRTLSANIAVEIPEAPHGGTLYRVLFLAALLLFLATFLVNTLAEIVRTRMRKRYATL